MHIRDQVAIIGVAPQRSFQTYIRTMHETGEISARSVVLDSHRERFGFREVRTDGDHIVLNGEVIHVPGRHDQGLTYALGMVDADNSAAFLRDIRSKGVLITRDNIAQVPAWHWAMCDEIGIFGGTNSLPWCNGQPLFRVRDPAAHKNFKNHIISYIAEHYNHPSIITHNYGNEMFHGPFNAPEVQKMIGGVLRAAKAFDPTRLTKTDGGGDPDGAADLIDVHYMNIGHAWREGRGWKGLVAKRAEQGKPVKPVITGEFSWNRYPTSGTFWAGSEVAKPGPIRSSRPSWANMATDQDPLFEQCEADYRKYREHGIAMYVSLGSGFTWRHLAPIFADFHDGYAGDEVHRFRRRVWSGEPVAVRFVVANDSGAAGSVALNLVDLDDGARVLWSGEVSLPQGELRLWRPPCLRSLRARRRSIALSCARVSVTSLVTRCNNAGKCSRVTSPALLAIPQSRLCLAMAPLWPWSRRLVAVPRW
ncbi:MAG: hypothetical protein PF961_17955 [Planctomycetota bacterium]|jgi:hypothetical protein|nr:hypothetical protein [Planctomycetota bacterium]